MGSLPQFRLVQDVQAPVQGAKEDRRVHVALVIGAEDDGAIARHPVAPVDTVADAGQAKGKRDADVAELVEQPNPLERHGDRHPQDAGNDDVE